MANSVLNEFSDFFEDAKTEISKNVPDLKGAFVQPNMSNIMDENTKLKNEVERLKKTNADLVFANLLNRDDLPTLVLPTSATVVFIYFKLTPTIEPSISCANNLSEKTATWDIDFKFVLVSPVIIPVSASNSWMYPSKSPK